MSSEIEQKQAKFHSITQDGYKEYNLGNYYRAKNIHDTAIALAKEINDHDLICKASTNLGNCCFRVGKMDEALFYHINAEEIAEICRKDFKKKKSPLEITNAMFELPGIKNHIGLIHLKKGLFSEADKEFDHGIKIASELKQIENLHPEIIAKLQNVSIRLRVSKIERLQLTLDWNLVEKELLGLIIEVRSILPNPPNYNAVYIRLNTRIYANLSIMLGSLYMNNNEMDKATEYINIGETIGTELNDTEIKRLAIFKKSQSLYLKKNDELAYKLLQNPLFQLKEKGGLLENKKDLIEYYLFLAELYANQNHLKECFELLLETQKEISSNGYDIDILKLFILMTKFSLEEGTLENAKNLLNFLISKVTTENQDRKGQNSDIIFPREILNNILKEILNNFSKTENVETRKKTIQRIDDFLRNIYRKINLVSFRFAEKPQNESLTVLIQGSILFFSTIFTLPESYINFKDNWYNIYKKRFAKISEISLEELIAIKYNELNLKRYEDCILKLYNIIEIEIYRHFINPIKIYIIKQDSHLEISSDLPYDNRDEDKYFRQFREFILDENEDLKFIAIEKFLIYLTGLQKGKWVESWKDTISIVNNRISERDIVRLKNVSQFLSKTWSTTLGPKRFREIRNNIVHNVNAIFSKQELESLFFIFKTNILGEEEIKAENSNQQISLLKELTNISIKVEK
jgi:CRISPR/Cas system-associated protein endoribonuclease Cas2